MSVKLTRSGVLVALGLVASTAYAGDVPANLGYGAEKLVESQVLLRGGAARGPLYNGFATEAAADYAARAIVEPETGRYLVDILPRRVGVDALQNLIAAKIPSFRTVAVDRNYRSTGIIEGYVDVNDLAALANVPGVRSVFLGLKPETNGGVNAGTKSTPEPNIAPGAQIRKLGTAFDQGVIQHRVDRINQFYNPSAPVNYDGAGISVGLMSDSYDTRTAAPHAATGVTNFDLPGAPGNPINTQPVVVLQDEPVPGTDEGRAMVEIVYKMAPRARLAFVTGVIGEVEFGNDIRALAALPGFEYAPGTQQGFKADVIADDISYGGEPFFGESIIGNAIDDVAAAGVSYFSSAGNNIGINAYESVLRWVPNGTGNTSATNAALAGTNIDLTGVPANLYAGGFHNFNPAAGQQDVAQLVNTPNTSAATGSTEMQWDDPYDQRDLVLVQPPLFTGTGTTNGTFNGASVPALPQFTAGTPVVITETATSGDFDGIVTIIDPNGATLINQDTGADETVTFFVPISGQYQIVVAPFSTTTGNFTVTVNTAQGSGSVTTDLNLLVFRADTGAYVASRSLTTNNIANNRPVELGTIFVAGQTQTQFVISRSNTPVAPQLPTRVRWSTRGNGLANIGPAEYFTYNATTTKGHATAKGCNGTAAYSVFRPSLPESFTSPGPAVIYFDKDSNRLPTPEYRQVPRVAAADAANTSFFSSTDSGSDLDTTQNFSGTSAAAPHAAAIAALVLQAHGGPGSLSPQDMRTILQTNVFPHDLDPSSASGTAVTSDGGGVIITIDADNDANAATGDNDPASIKVSYVGPGSLASLTFNPFGSAFNGGNVTGGNNGYVDDVGSNPATVSYFDNNYPGLLFLPNTKAFTLGTLTGLVPADIAAPQSVAPFNGFSNLGPAPANGTTHFWTMNVGFPTGQFTDGKVMRFTVGRGAAHSSSVVGTVPGIGPTGGTVTRNPIADLFGGGVMLPSGTVIADGMLFTGTTTSGGTFSGRIRNNIGTGYSVVDGYGFIDAAAATGAVGGMLAATATSSPAFAGVSGQVLFTVNVTPGVSPASTGIAVFGNLNPIGGGGFQQFFDNGTNGDVTAGDNVYSFLGTVAQGTTPGAKQIVASVTDQQSRTGTAVVNFAVLSPASPSGLGSASPNSGNVGSITLLTVQVTPGASPASTGIVVRANLGSIGGSATQQLFDNGTNGDVTAGDGNYSFSATVAPATTAGAKLFAVTITDAQLRTGNTSIAYSVLAPTAISGFGSATPGSAAIGQPSLLTVSVTPGANPVSSGVTVTADLGSIGGSATQALYDDGSNGDVTAGDWVFSFGATVGVGTTPGTKNLAVSIGDAQARTANASIVLNVPGPNAPTGTGFATPTMVILGAPTTLAVAVTPGNTPVSTGLAVTVDLSAIGGSATQAFYDDGTNGDQVAGDNIFTFSTTVPAETAAGVVLLPVTITDAQLRSGGATITVDVRTNLVFSDGYDDL